MNLYYIITDSQKKLEQEYFLPSISIDKEINTIPVYYKPKVSNLGNFWDEDYLETLLFRNQSIIDLIEDNIGQQIILSDVDILIVKPFSEYIKNTITNKDILHMRDGIDGINIINGGFTVINCNETTKSFYNYILKNVLNSNNKKYLDQDAIKDYYYTDNNPLNLRWDYLPASMFAVRYEWNFLEKNKNNLVMFHATNTLPYGNISSVQRKIHYLEMFKKWHNNEIGKFYE